jgi:hypothetical protein
MVKFSLERFVLVHSVVTVIYNLWLMWQYHSEILPVLQPSFLYNNHQCNTLITSLMSQTTFRFLSPCLTHMVQACSQLSRSCRFALVTFERRLSGRYRFVSSRFWWPQATRNCSLAQSLIYLTFILIIFVFSSRE